MSNTASNVSVGKPNVGGAISSAPVGTVLPTDATTALNAAFKGLGYVDENGLANGGSTTRDNFKAWGGDVVLSSQSEKTDTFRFTLIESTNSDVLKFVHGNNNVSGSLAAGMTVKVNSADPGERSMVVDMLLRDGGVKRIVVPRGVLSDVAEVVYRGNAVIGYTCTILAMPDTAGNTHYEYIKRTSS